MDYLYIGKLVNTHGVRGEVRILSNFKHKDKIFIPGFKLYIGKNKKEFEITKYRFHKIFDMILFKGLEDINLVEYLKGSLVYIDKNSLKLDDNVTLAIDLIGYGVIIENNLVGEVLDILDTGANEVLSVTNNILIPYVKDFIISIDSNNKTITVKNIKGLIS